MYNNTTIIKEFLKELYEDQDLKLVVKIIGEDKRVIIHHNDNTTLNEDYLLTKNHKRKIAIFINQITHLTLIKE